MDICFFFFFFWEVRKEISKSSKRDECEMSQHDSLPVSDPNIVRKEIAIMWTFEAEGSKNIEDIVFF